MFWKLVTVVVTLGGVASGLLVLRQQEIDLLAANTDVHFRAERMEQTLQMVRWKLDGLSTEDRLRAWLQEHGPDCESIEAWTEIYALGNRWPGLDRLPELPGTTVLGDASRGVDGW